MAQPQKGPIVLIVGTRPEGIKMMPLYFALKRAGLSTLLCSTMQHDQLLTQVFELFQVQPDIDLSVMRLGQDLFYLTQSVLQKTKEVFQRVKPSLVLVQGDTTSTMAAAMAAFYLDIPVGHVEAGLRTDDIRSPFPEEMNRRVVGIIANYHFAPTALATANLLSQGIDHTNVFCTGNTVVDALRLVKEKIDTGAVTIRPAVAQQVARCKEVNQKIVLLTMHRRESFGTDIVRALGAVKQFLVEHPEIFCFYPFHPNPNVIQAIESIGLASLENIVVCEPVEYKDLVYLLLESDLILTDSGGIQEEAVSLGKQVLVLREKTERIEGCWAGLAHIVGTDPKKIKDGLQSLLSQANSDPIAQTIYGDGYAAEKITTIISSRLDSLAMRVADIQTSPATVIKIKEDTSMKKICVLGLGYIGLPTAIVAAESGFAVIGVDIDEARVTKINEGDPVIQEPEVFEKLQLARMSGCFKATTKPEVADYFVIAVPTPFYEDKSADLSYVMSATDAIASVLKKGDGVILESTVPVGTTDKIAKRLEQLTGMRTGTDFFVAHCPERVLPGNIFHELVHNARIIGGIDRASADNATAMYKQFVRGRLYITNATAAEMVKLVENSSRDVQIAFANQVAAMAYSAGLDPFEVIELANKHPRVDILKPSCGVGGHCIAVDPWFLVESFPAQTKLLRAAREVNDAKPHEVIRFITTAIARCTANHSGTQCSVLLLGLTYKPDVDDLRESPALAIAQIMSGQTHANVMVCEPHINKQKLATMFADRVVSVSQGLETAHIVVYLVGHKQFKAIDTKLLQDKKILDFCGALHIPKPDTHEQEYFFWPASSVADYADMQHIMHDEKIKESSV